MCLLSFISFSVNKMTRKVRGEFYGESMLEKVCLKGGLMLMRDKGDRKVK